MSIKNGSSLLAGNVYLLPMADGKKKFSQLLCKALSMQLGTSGLFCVQSFTQGICNSLVKLDF